MRGMSRDVSSSPGGPPTPTWFQWAGMLLPPFPEQAVVDAWSRPRADAASAQAPGAQAEMITATAELWPPWRLPLQRRAGSTLAPAHYGADSLTLRRLVSQAEVWDRGCRSLDCPPGRRARLGVALERRLAVEDSSTDQAAAAGMTVRPPGIRSTHLPRDTWPGLGYRLRTTWALYVTLPGRPDSSLRGVTDMDYVILHPATTAPSQFPRPEELRSPLTFQTLCTRWSGRELLWLVKYAWGTEAGEASGGAGAGGARVTRAPLLTQMAAPFTAQAIREAPAPKIGGLRPGQS